MGVAPLRQEMGYAWMEVGSKSPFRCFIYVELWVWRRLVGLDGMKVRTGKSSGGEMCGSVHFPCGGKGERQRTTSGQEKGRARKAGKMWSSASQLSRVPRREHMGHGQEGEWLIRIARFAGSVQQTKAALLRERSSGIEPPRTCLGRAESSRVESCCREIGL